DFDKLLFWHAQRRHQSVWGEPGADLLQPAGGHRGSRLPIHYLPQLIAVIRNRDILRDTKIREKGRLLIDGRNAEFAGLRGIVVLDWLAMQSYSPTVGLYGAGQDLD